MHLLRRILEVSGFLAWAFEHLAGDVPLLVGEEKRIKSLVVTELTLAGGTRTAGAETRTKSVTKPEKENVD
jgi:hypothetical protein